MLSWRRAVPQVNGAGCSCGWCLPALLVYSGFPKQTPSSQQKLELQTRSPQTTSCPEPLTVISSCRFTTGLFPFCILPSTSQTQTCFPRGCYLTALPGIVTATSFLPKGLRACPSRLQFSSLLLLAPFPLTHREARRFRGPVLQRALSLLLPSRLLLDALVSPPYPFLFDCFHIPEHPAFMLPTSS